MGTSAVPLTPPVDFDLQTLDGRPFGSSTTRGAPTILAFVTTGSLPSQAQVDYLVAMAKRDGDRVHYAVVALEEGANRELVALYAKALSVPFPVALADEATLTGVGPFGDVHAVPVTVLLDAAGRVVWRVEGRVAPSEEIRRAMHGI